MWKEKGRTEEVSSTRGVDILNKLRERLTEWSIKNRGEAMPRYDLYDYEWHEAAKALRVNIEADEFLFMGTRISKVPSMYETPAIHFS